MVDLDVKPGVSGVEEFHKRHRDATGEDFPETLIVRTGTGGAHLYFAHPGFAVKTCTKIMPGVDVRGEGGFVVGPGSVHVCGAAYEIVHDGPIAHAPAWLLDYPGLKRGGSSAVVETPADLEAWIPVPVDTTSAEGLRRIDCFVLEAQGVGPHALPPAIEGQRGHDRLFHAAKRGTTYWCLPQSTTAAILAEHYNARCVPPWSEQEIQRKVHEAMRTNREPTPGPPPDGWGDRLAKIAILYPDARDAQGAPVTLEGIPEDPEIEPRRADGTPHTYAAAAGESIASGKLSKRPISEIVFRLARSPQWAGALQWDEFRDVVRAVKPPIRLDAERSISGLSDGDVTSVRIWFETQADTAIGDVEARAAIYAAAHTCKVHPVRSYLNALPVGDPRVLDHLASRWFGCPEGDVSNDLLRLFLVGAVRRILQPGVQMDTMIVLYSHDQGVGKSQWIRSLFGADWSIAQMPDLGDGVRASQQIATTWCAEFSELDRLLRIEASTAKEFLSRCVDTYRPAYGREIVSKARQCVFVGTTNDIDFLRDPTGARRFWPIEVHSRIDQEIVRADRDAVWAAALFLALRTASEFPHWIEAGSPLDLRLRGVQEVHRSIDEWEAPIRDYCAGRDVANLLDVWKVAIQRGAAGWLERFDRRAQARVAGILRQIGARASGSRDGRGWVLPDTIATATPSPAEARRRRAEEGIASGASLLSLVPPPAAEGVSGVGA